jgi:C4-dicarboxylate-specific signal transduction histidine kinase
MCQANKILIIDDEEIIRDCIAMFLEDNGYIALEADSGAKGLQLFEEEKPNLILTDLNMPGINGFKIVEKINKQSPITPTIVISGGGMIEDSIRAIRLGAWDYITKPIHDFAELDHRIKNALERSRLIKENEQHQEHLESEIIKRTAQLCELNEQLEQKVIERTQKLSEANEALQDSLNRLKNTQAKLIESEKMAALGGLVAGVAHEINTPIGIGVTAASHLEERTAYFFKRYQEGQLSRADFEKFLSVSRDSAKIILNNMVRAASLIQSFKKVAVDQSSQERRHFNLKEYLDEILLSLKPKFKNCNHTITIECDNNIQMNSYPGALSQAITNLLVNSLTHAFDDNEPGLITINVTPADNKVTIVYHDSGKGIPKRHLSQIFNPFFTTKRGQGGSGLGMHIVYNLVTQTLKGEISCKSEVNKGTTFTIDMPMVIDDNQDNRSDKGY